MHEPDLDPELSTDRKVDAMDRAPIGIVISDARRDDNPLIYVNDAFERITGYEREEIIGLNCRFLQGKETNESARGELREAINAGESTVVELRNYRKDGSLFWNEVTVAPIYDEQERITHFVGFQVDITARKEAEIEVRTRRKELSQLVTRLHGLLQDVTATLMRTHQQDAMERAVCDRIVESGPYTFAAFGELEFTQELVSLTTTSNTQHGTRQFPLESDHPISAAIAERTVQISDHPDHCQAVCDDIVSMAVAPLTYRDRVFGVLILGGSTTDAFDGRERAVVEALGRTIAMAIDAAESRHVLVADNVVELEVVVSDDRFAFQKIATECDTTLTFEGALSLSSTGVSLCFSTDVPIDRIEAVSPSGVQRIVDDEDRTMFGLEITDQDVLSTLSSFGAKVIDLEVTPEHAIFSLEIIRPGNPRSVVEWLRERFASIDVRAVRERERPPSAKTDFLRDIDNRLTDRQRTAIQLAYAAGYYDEQRSTSGVQLAESMHITRATFHQHRRTAERKLIGEFLDESTYT